MSEPQHHWALDCPEDEARAKLYAERHDPMFISDEGRIEWPIGEWADGSFRLPNHHTCWEPIYDPARALAECAAKRAIVKFHEEWPVLVEREPTFESDPTDSPLGMTIRMGRQIAWLSEREYIKRFGVDPPTAPMIRTLAAVYADHEDYRQEWAL